MATIQKEKIKKKKKNKEVLIDEPTSEEYFEDEISSTTVSKNLVTHECFVSSEFKSPDKENLNNDNEDQTNSRSKCLLSPSKEENRDNLSKDIVTENIIDLSQNIVKADPKISPSAPNIEKSKTDICIFENTFNKYPDLKKLEIRSECVIESVRETMSKTKQPNPMTKVQLDKLYDCKMLDLVKQFELEFLANTLQQNFENDPLYIYLQQYAVARSKIKVNQTDLEELGNKFELLKNSVWKTNIEVEQASSTCNDNIRVYAKENYETIVIDEKNLQNLLSTLNMKYELVCYSYNKNKMNAETSRLKVEQIIREILTHPCFKEIESNISFQVLTQNDSLTLHGLNHLRRALSILFSCLRKPSPDKVFTNVLVEWICTLVAAYMRIATIQDHWFLLFHILRCPSGVSKWATNFIQIPEPKIPIVGDLMECVEISQCLSILHILLLPIKKRNEFLQSLSRAHREISDPVKDDVWIIVDSDGEEGSDFKGECVGIKENDLICFLNQIPLEMLFRCIINVEKKESEYKVEGDRISEQQFLKLIAFCTKLVELFGDGLLTYNTERYKQFAKRLGRLIRHTIHYVSDIHEVFLRNKLSKDPYLCEQISVEMNSFIIKSCSYIYKTPSLATWQYFSSLPFSLLETDTLWQLFLYLNIGFPDDFPVPNEDFKQSLFQQNFWSRFNVIASDLSSEDLYYLIQAFFEMANERDRTKDWEFIEIVCLHIFMIGFLNEPTRETCYKTSRDMLTNLTLSYPELIASLLQQMKIRFGETDNLIYLIKSLPLENWKTDIQSFEILSAWLTNYNYDCKENALARIIISHLNWAFDSDKRLFLPHNIHVRMACLVCEALNKHNPQIIGSSTISESMKQVSNLIENHCNKEQFTTWCWNMISLLRLHLMDQSSEAAKRTLQNPSDHLCFVPELENFDIIYQGVTENRPSALYISILISLWGHSIPLICQKGIPQMKLLLLDHRYTSVIRCIQLITPLFLESPDTLANCDSFQEILKIIFNADRTYLKMAKDLVGSNSNGPVFEHFINMLQSQIIHYYEIGLTTPSLFIHLWLEILTAFPNWQNTNVVYLIDAILKIAYQFSDSWSNCKEFFREYYKNSNNWKTNGTSTFKMFLGTGTQNNNFPTLSTDCGWMSLLLLELEHETQEYSNFLWSELLRNLYDGNEKNMENTLKKSCNAVGYPQFSLPSLVLYKYSTLITNADINHPLLPIYGQKFFLLYLDRINFNQDEERFHNMFAVSDKFYEYNIPLMKKMKIKLKLAEENYSKLSSDNADNEVLSYFYTQCSKIMKTYLLWLEETDLQKISKFQRIDLPPQYNAEKLTDIINGNEQHWTEFIYLRKIRDQQKNASNKWLKYCFRLHEVQLRCGEILQSKKHINAIDRIKNHLKSYEKPLPPPVHNKLPLIFNQLASHSICSRTLEELRKELKYVNEFTNNLNIKYKKIKSLDCNFKDQIQLLYKNILYLKEVSQDCSSITRFNKVCTGPALINLKLKRPQKMESVQRKLDENREKYDNIIQDILNSNINALVYSIQNMEHIVRCLLIAQGEVSEKGHKENIHITRVAIDFFYDILKGINNKIQILQPCDDSFSSMIHELGIFIQNSQETEGLRILDMSIKCPDLLQLLSELFIPNKTISKSFLDMYKFLVDAHINNHDKKTIFVFLSKFDLCNWLQVQQIHLPQLLQMLELIIRGLENWNKPESSLIQDIFRRHLADLFNYEFPKYFLEILGIVLKSVSEQKICTVVLLDLLNTLFEKVGCENLTLESTKIQIEEQSIKFANKQNFLDFKTVNDTFLLFSQHFQNERLKNGLHGLYPKHKNYCLPLSIWFTVLCRTLVISAISTYAGVLGEQICNSVFGPIISLFSPWIAIYRQQDFQQLTANWTTQFKLSGKDLLPWSDSYLETAEYMIDSFINSLQYILKNLPVSNTILGHVYSWYQHHFIGQDSSKQVIQVPIHKSLKQLSWEKFSPQSNHIDCFYRTISENSAECLSFLGEILIEVKWSNWIKEQFYSWDSRTQNHAINLLLPIFVEISFEPNVNSKFEQAKNLEECLEFPWHLVDSKNVEAVFNWLILSVNPILLLNLSSEKCKVNHAVLKLLQKACGMSKYSELKGIKYQIQQKRVLYVNAIVRMLHTCLNNNNRSLVTAESLKAHQNVLVEVLNNIEDILLNESSIKERENEGQNLILEVIGSLQNKNHSSKLFVDAIVYWQSKCSPNSNVLNLTLNSFGLCKTFNNNMYPLLEATLYNFFRFANTDNQISTWKTVFQRLNVVINNFHYQTLLNGSYFLTLHTYFLYKIQNMGSPGEKITFLQDISQILESLKSNETNESRLVLIWGAVITCGCKMLILTKNVKKTLLMIARQLHILAKRSEGWGDSLLGVIGLRRDNSFYKRKILFKCLSSIIFSLFPDQSGSQFKESQEFIMTVNELINESMNKSNTNLKQEITKAIEIITKNKINEPEKVAEAVFVLINIFYNDNFIKSAQEVWII